MRRHSALAGLAALSLVAACSSSGSSSTDTTPTDSPMPSSSSASPSASPLPSPSATVTAPAVTQDVGRPAIQSVKAALPGIERFVEQERGLKFKRPVKAKLLGTTAFRAKLDQGDKPPPPLAIEKMTALLASIGLINPHVDLLRAFNTAYDVGTLGFYDPKTKRLYVKGTRATPGVRAVLSHELTHALTDQWFGLRRKKLNHDHEERDEAFTALSEGDAERTRKAYQAEVLSPAEDKLAKKEESAGGKPPHVPKIVLEIIGFPYEIGPRFVGAVVTHGGIKALNAAYRHPPVSTEQLLVAQKFFDGVKPTHIPIPKSDAARLDYGDLGLVGLLLMLENGVPRSSAPYGLTDWAGDQYSVWRAGTDRWCLRDTVTFDSDFSSGEFDSALKTWVGTRHKAAHIEKTGRTTTFVTCSS